MQASIGVNHGNNYTIKAESPQGLELSGAKFSTVLLPRGDAALSRCGDASRRSEGNPLAALAHECDKPREAVNIDLIFIESSRHSYAKVVSLW